MAKVAADETAAAGQEVTAGLEAEMERAAAGT